MMRFPGNSVAKNFRLVRRSQYRHCSSMSDKDVQMGDFELFVDNMAGLFFKGAFGVVGFVLGGLTSTGVSEKIQKDEENFRLVRRSQYRHCSSMSDKDVQMGDFELFVDNMAGLFFKGAFGVVGFVLGGLTSTGVSEKVQKEEEILIIMKKHNDEHEKDLELMRQRHLERNRIVSSRNVHTVEGKHTSI